MKVIHPGHKYELASLDGECRQVLTFVQRVGPKFPGNRIAYPGTTLQNVLRALIERMRYLQNQVWSAENAGIIFALRGCLWLLEFRAARRHGRSYFHGFAFAEFSPMCKECGHTSCEHENNSI